MIDCDQAFDCLTDAARRESPELRNHLDSCPRCRQMAETLAPAIDLLWGPVPPWMQAEAVTTATAPTATAVRIAQRNARRLSTWRGTLVRGWGSHLVAGLVGAAAGLVAMAFVPPPQAAPGDVPAICTWNDRGTVPARDARTLTRSCVVCHLEVDRERTTLLVEPEPEAPIILAGSTGMPRSEAPLIASTVCERLHDASTVRFL